MSETTYLKLFKHDNPSTNTNQFDVDKALNQNLDKLDDFAGDVNEKVQEIEGNIAEQEQDIVYVKEELETEINELQKDIQANSIIEETEQAKSLYIDDATDSRGKIEVLGNVEQETNLYNGKLEQGSLSESGTVDTNSRIRTVDYIEAKENTEIKVSADGANQYLLAFYNASKEYMSSSAWVNLGTGTTIIASAKYAKVILRKTDNSTINVADISNFVVGDTPSINYPSKLQCLGSNKNLFNINGTRAEQSTGECSYSDGKITITKAGPIRTIADGLKIGKSYILSWGNGNINSIQTVYTSSNTNIDRNYNMNSSTKFIASESTVTVSILNTEAGQYIENLKLEEGETATTYSPYRTRQYRNKCCK